MHANIPSYDGRRPQADTAKVREQVAAPTVDPMQSIVDSVLGEGRQTRTAHELLLAVARAGYAAGYGAASA